MGKRNYSLCSLGKITEHHQAQQAPDVPSSLHILASPTFILSENCTALPDQMTHLPSSPNDPYSLPANKWPFRPLSPPGHAQLYSEQPSLPHPQDGLLCGCPYLHLCGLRHVLRPSQLYPCAHRGACHSSQTPAAHWGPAPNPLLAWQLCLGHGAGAVWQRLMQDGMGKVLGMVADFMFSCMKKQGG